MTKEAVPAIVLREAVVAFPAGKANVYPVGGKCTKGVIHYHITEISLTRI